MFTGIVEEVGSVISLQRGGREALLGIVAERVLEGTELGGSLAVNGACLTVVELGAGYFGAGLMPETLARTNLGLLRPGSLVNLERPLAVGDRFGGHFVQGHVDGMGRVETMRGERSALVVTISAPPELLRYIVPQGFIAVDGVSLTAVERTESGFTVSLVSYTQEHTNLSRQRVGYAVNLEVDILGKYVETLLGGESGSRGITEETLRRHGYV